MSESTNFRGVFAPVLTPFHSDLTPDTERWIAFSRHLLDSGCHGLCPFGTTSEANSVGMEERMDMLEQLVAAGIPASKLMPGTGMCAIPDSVRLTAHAVKQGVGGVLMLPPFYYKGVPDDGLFAGIAEVIEGVGDDRLRIYLYHIPPIAQVGFPIGVIERLVSAYPNTVVGIKDSSRDWNNLNAILTTFSGTGFGTFSGTEMFLLETLRLGGAGTISAMSNLIPEKLRALYDNWQSENAEELQVEANGMRTTVEGYAPIPAIKAIIADRFDDVGWRTVRPPLVTLNDDEAAAVLARVKALNVPA